MTLNDRLVAFFDQFEGPTLAGLDPPAKVNWLDKYPGLGELVPADLDRAIHLMNTLDGLFLESVGGVNPIENWRATVLSKTIEALKVELQKPKNGRYPDAFMPHNHLPPKSSIREMIKKDAVIAISYFERIFEGRVDKSRRNVSKVMGRYGVPRSTRTLSKWQTEFEADNPISYQDSLFVQRLPFRCKRPYLAEACDRDEIENAFCYAIRTRAGQLAQIDDMESAMETKTRRRANLV